MAASKASEIPKLFAVTLIRSGIRQPYWEKRTLKALGLTKLHKTVIHKNSPSVNGQLNAVKHLISIKPLDVISNIEAKKVDGDSQNSSKNDSPVFLKENGSFDMDKYAQFCRKESKTKSKSPDYSIVA
jgi:large subunit ribosomal protein L30